MTCLECGARSIVYLCRTHANRLRELIAQTPWLLARLDETATRQNAFGSAPVAGRRPASEEEEESPLPFLAAPRRVRDALENMLGVWVRDVDERTGRSLCAHATGRITHADQAVWLLGHLDHVLSTEDAGMALHEFEDAVASAVAALNRPAPPVYRGPCPTVTARDRRGRPVTCAHPLYAARMDTEAGVTVGADAVTCARCGTLHDGRKLERDLLSQVGAYLMTGPEVLDVMARLGEPVPKATWHNWRAKGKLQPRAWRHRGTITGVWITESDEKLYRLDDVRQLRAAGNRPGPGRPRSHPEGG